MAAHLPVVTDGHLDLPSPANTVQIAIDSPAWFAWLELPGTRSFTFQDASGHFTARKERRQRAGEYWIAYRKAAGKLRNVYLGKSVQLTWERLTTAAVRLAVQQSPPTDPQARTPGIQAEAARSQPAYLLTTKLSVPPVRPSAIPRPHLLEELEAGLHGKLTLISAPAGFGKTTLLSAWCATLRDQAVPLAWVSLDAGDADPTQFWTYVITALDTLQPGSGSQALALLQAPQPPPIAALLAPLLSRLNTLPGDAVLVLDDYHVIATPSIHQDVAFLLDHLPPRLHLVIATRADPALALSRLRAGGALTELRAADLRFALGEAASFLAEAMKFPLSAADVAALEERTEGWIAGLQFAALAMRNRTDLSGFVQAFTGSHRFVVDYLAEEVFTRQPAHLQAFLLRTAILDRMCGALCDAVLLGDMPDPPPHQSGSPSGNEQAYSQTLLDELERANLFLVPLDDERRWYRYHHLFADVLRQRLTSGASRDAVRALHRRASAWYEREGLIREAMQHALAGDGWERAACMIEEHAMPFIFRGQVHTVLGWLERLPDALVRVRSRLGLIYALALGDTFQVEAAETRLQDVERSVHVEMSPEQAGAILGEVALTRAMLARSLGHLARCVALSQRALDMLPASEVAQRSSARVNLARAYLVSGDVTHINERLARDVIVPARASGNLFAALSAFTNLARLQVLQGRLRAAAATYAQAEELAPEVGGLRMLGSASASFYIGLGDLHREWNDLEQAEQHLAQAMDLIRGPLTIDADVVTQGYITLARVQQARAESGRAGTTLSEFANLAHERKFAAHLIARGAAAQAALALAQGNLPATIAWAESSDLHAGAELMYPREAEYLTLVRLRIAQARAAAAHSSAAQFLDAALSLLGRLLQTAEANARMGSIVEMLILRALALQARGDLSSARQALARALMLAEPEGYIRVFVDEGPPMELLLREAQAHGIAPDYVASLLSHVRLPMLDVGSGDEPPIQNPKSQIQKLDEPLSSRELEVLRLMMAGKSNAEIAQALVIALSTVKTHTNNIYGKLGVTRRTAAIARARELHLL